MDKGKDTRLSRFDALVQEEADWLEAEFGEVDPEKLERRIAARLAKMDLTERELSEMIVGSRANPSFARAVREIGKGLRRAADRMRGK